MSSGLRAVANTRQPRAFISRAEASPMPEEQPVMRIERSGQELARAARIALLRRRLLGRHGLLLDGFQSSQKDIADDLLGLVVALAVGVEGRIPMDDGAAGSRSSGSTQSLAE